MFLLSSLALAASPPSVDDPLASGLKNKKDAAVVIGVGDYDQLPDVPHALNDSVAVKDYLERTQGLNRKNLVYLEDPHAKTMKEGVARAAARVQKGGTLWVYFAGQGEGSGATANLLSADGKGLSLAEIEQIATRSRAAHVVVIVDAAFDGAQRDEVKALALPSSPVRWEASSPKVTLWVADTSGHAANYEAGDHGLFTYLALGALQGWADLDANGAVTLGEAQSWVRAHTAALGRAQQPNMELRPEVSAWVLNGAKLAPAPAESTWPPLSVEDRDQRLASASKRLQDQAQAELDAAVAAFKAGAPDSEKALRETIARYESASVSVSWVPPVPALAQARAALAAPPAPAVAVVEPGPAPATPPPATPPPATPPPATPPPATATPPVATPPPAAVTAPAVAVVEGSPGGPKLSDDKCSDLVGMEPEALMGTFSPGRVACIEKRLADPKESQTNKDKLSRLLMANAEATQNWAEWERLMRRHLENIDRSDPDLCMRFAVYLQKQGVEYGEEVIRWADAALENKARWSGDTYKKRLYALYRLRAEAAAELWKDAEQNLIAEPTDANDALTQKWRGRAKDYSREWLDYAKLAGMDVEKPMQLCLAAAGTKKACEDPK